MTIINSVTEVYPFKFELRIDWSDLDILGHVNNLAIMRYVQSARVYVTETTGLSQFRKDTGVGPILARTSCQFIRQLYYPGMVVVWSKIDHIKTTSYQINHVVLNEGEEVIADAHDVIVCFDFDNNAKVPLPKRFAIIL